MVLHSDFGSSKQPKSHGIGVSDNCLLASQHVIILNAFMYVYDINSYIIESVDSIYRDNADT